MLVLAQAFGSHRSVPPWSATCSARRMCRRRLREGEFSRRASCRSSCVPRCTEGVNVSGYNVGDLSAREQDADSKPYDIVIRTMGGRVASRRDHGHSPTSAQRILRRARWSAARCTSHPRGQPARGCDRVTAPPRQALVLNRCEFSDTGLRRKPPADVGREESRPYIGRTRTIGAVLAMFGGFSRLFPAGLLRTNDRRTQGDRCARMGSKKRTWQ